jgi:hypothetical protein
MKGTIETEKETPVHSRTVQERIRSGGRNEACTVREGMLWSREFSARRFGKLQDLRCRQGIRHVHHWRMQCHVSQRKQTRRLRGSHRLAAVVTLVRRVTGPGAAALHALLIHGHGRHAGGELQEQDRDHCQHDECVFPNHLFRL